MGLFEDKIQQFPEVISWVKKQDIYKIKEFLANPDKPKLFISSGGSFSACAFGELISVKKGIMAHAMTPYFYITSGYEKVKADAILISASGANMDIARAFDSAYRRGNNLCALILQSVGKLQKRFAVNNVDCLLCNDLNMGREGFLSTTSVVAFYALLYRAYGYKDLDQLSTANNYGLNQDK